MKAGGLGFSRRPRYHARYYDPLIGRFISADTIVPKPGDPQSLNRYSYVRNNPLKYTDPSGHVRSNERQKADDFLNLLSNDYEVEILKDWGFDHTGTWSYGSWTIDDLGKVLQAVQNLAGAMGGAEYFRKAFQGVQIDRKAMRAGGLGADHHIWLNSKRFDKWTVVHELGLAWDAVNGWQLSRDMQKAMGAGFPYLHKLFPDDPAFWYAPGNGPPPCGIDANFNRKEDFAEAVAAYVYPKEAWNRAHPDNPRVNWQAWPYNDPVRGYDYVSFHATPRGQFIDALIVTLQ